MLDPGRLEIRKRWHPQRSALRLLISVVVLAMGGWGCGYDSTQIPPPRGSLVGTWRVDKTLSDPVLPVAKIEDQSSLILNEDGTFSARNLRDWRYDNVRMLGDANVFRAPRVLPSASGKWTLDKARSGWVVTLYFPELPGAPQGLQVPVYLHRQAAPYLLGFSLGDPDEGRWLIFVQNGPASAHSSQ